MKFDRRLAMFGPLAALPASISGNLSTELGGAPMPGSISIREFGAHLDGTSDDSGALQRALNECMKDNSARSLLIDGPCRIDRTVFLDRPVDQTRGVLRIRGSGSFGGFIVAGNFALFDSRLANGGAPVSEHVWFQDIRFEALARATTSSALSEKFLRIRFHDCEFEHIRALASTNYAQEWQFHRCAAHRWPGTFFSSRGGYHITSTGSTYRQGGGDVFEILDPTLQKAGCVGCSFHQDISESNSGSFLKAAVVRGLSIAGLYSEGNASPTLDFESSAANHGISVSGCMFAPQDRNKKNPDFFDVRWGYIEGGHASGNYSTGRLHRRDPRNPKEPIISGDFSTTS